MGRATRTDAHLIAACRGGDREAFGELVERYQRTVAAVAYGATRDRALAEDVTQETFVTAWRQLATLRDVDRLPGWLCGIARNVARAARRKRDREAPLDDHDVAGDGSPYEQLRDREDEHVVAASLARVPETYREALVLFYFEQQSVKAVARALGISENATHQRLARGRQQLAADVGLVERTLERRRPHAGLAVAVLAAIGALEAIDSSQVEAAPSRQESTMPTLKLTLAAALLTAITATGYVVARSHDEPAAPATSALAAAPHTPHAGEPLAARAPATHPASSTTPAAPSSTTARDTSSGDPLACASVARHLASMVALTQADVVEALERGDERLLEHVARPIADDYLASCTELAWSLELRTCIARADDFVGLQAKCPPPPTRAAKRPGELQIIDDEPRPAYTGSDESCASVARHMVTLARPTEATLARLPVDQRASVREGMERMLATVPESVETNCETAPWSLAIRRCVLAATTQGKAIDCTRGAAP